MESCNYFWDWVIDQTGRQLRYYRSYRCSCYQRESGVANYNCNICHGRGWLFDTPVDYILQISSINLQRDFLPLGEVYTGDLICTIPKRRLNKNTTPYTLEDIPIYDTISENDYFTLLDVEVKCNEILIRGENDYLKNIEITEVISVNCKNIVYVQNQDYILNHNAIVWLGQREPKYSDSYSCQYICRPLFKVFIELPRIHGLGQTGGSYLPKRCLLRRADMLTEYDKTIQARI